MINELINTDKIKGELELKVYKDDKLVNEYKDHNLIVRNSCQIIANAMKIKEPTEGESRNFSINQICFGDGWEQLSLDKTTLAGNFYHRFIKGLQSATDPSGYVPETAGTSNVVISGNDIKLVIEFKLAKSEFNGSGDAGTHIKQFGLACATNPFSYGVTTGASFDGLFFSMINRYDNPNNWITKDPTVNIEGTWTITFLNSSAQ